MSEKEEKEKEIHAPTLYLEWLYNLVGGPEKGNYLYLFRRLQAREFFWMVPNDDNRAEDGKSLRGRFASETGITDVDILFGPCSILEMMVGLAVRWETNIMHDEDLGDRTAVWFWEMIKNLKLDKYTDEAFTVDSFTEVDKILTRFVNRRYRKSGKGGLFPLKHPKKDQTKVEIWEQITEYFKERYGV